MPTFIIQDVVFEYPSPYQSGDTLTDGEAKALNNLVRQHARKKYSDPIRAAGQLSLEQHEEFQAAIFEFIMHYNFDQHKAAQPQLTPLQTMMRKLARGRVRAMLEESNRKISDLTTAEIDEAIDNLLKALGPQIEEEAKVKLEHTQAMAKATLDELGLA